MNRNYMSFRLLDNAQQLHFEVESSLETRSCSIQPKDPSFWIPNGLNEVLLIARGTLLARS